MKGLLSDKEILDLLFCNESEDEDVSSDDDDIADPTVYFSDIDSIHNDSEGEKTFIRIYLIQGVIHMQLCYCRILHMSLVIDITYEINFYEYL